MKTVWSKLIWLVAMVAGYPFPLPKGSGPWVHPTLGAIWPKPQFQTFSPSFMILRPSLFQFQITDHSCDILDQAVHRYFKVIFSPARGQVKRPHDDSLDQKLQQADNFSGYLDQVSIELNQPCHRYPSYKADENYTITVDATHSLISSQSIWGILNGLESFSQLIYTSLDGVAFQINHTSVVDFPRFPHRGLMLDTSRHFLPLHVLKDHLDLMAHNKLNVFHWHFTDDTAFPYQSLTFPSLSEFGAYDRYSQVYTPSDVQEIIEYGRLRGIRILPEFDTPGHTQSWGPGMEGLLTQCYDKNGVAENFFGPINPLPAENYKFLTQFFKEIHRVFPDKYIHLGGDEVNFDCWASNPQISAFMKDHDMGSKYDKLEEYYMQKLINDTLKATNGGLEFQIWQEVIDNGVTVPEGTVVHVWKDGSNWEPEMRLVTSLGYPTLLSSPWYLNRINYGVDWDQYYNIEPLSFNGTESQKSLVMGGEVCMWTEFTDEVSITGRTWPRASAVAERLWSNQNVKNAGEAAPRLEEHRCRLLRRGYRVDPVNGPNHCKDVVY